MKIKIALLTSDTQYTDKLLAAITLQYADKVDLSIFTQKQVAETVLVEQRPNIFLVGDEFGAVDFKLPPSVELVYFVAQKGIHLINQHRAICKYQTISEIYRELLDVYAESAGSSVILQGDLNRVCQIITFCSAAGGTGTSVAAAAFARRLASQGQKVLYLNLEPCGNADLYFSGGGDSGFSDVLYSLAMANGMLSMRLESAAKQDACGVFYYSECASALDLLELDAEKMRQLFEELEKARLYEWIVVDTAFCFSSQMYQQIERSYRTVFVSDGSERANLKLNRCLDALTILNEQGTELPMDRIVLFYNRFSSKTGKRLRSLPYTEAGGVNRIENATTQELLQLLADNSELDAILQPVSGGGTI
ncbi:MAG: hypothetical protein LUF28_07965 [Clostridiales bacterium]|nr:hypothetical protein [Clostridiales bacterium]